MSISLCVDLVTRPVGQFSRVMTGGFSGHEAGLTPTAATGHVELLTDRRKRFEYPLHRRLLKRMDIDFCRLVRQEEM